MDKPIYTEFGEISVEMGVPLKSVSGIESRIDYPRQIKDLEAQREEMREALEKMANDGDALREGTIRVRPPQTECAKDNVEHPSHYTAGGIECIDAMKAMLSGYEQAKIATRFYWHFLSGQVLKYLWRWPLKERPLQDLKKARWYLDRLIEDIEKQDNQYSRKEASE